MVTVGSFRFECYLVMGLRPYLQPVYIFLRQTSNVEVGQFVSVLYNFLPVYSSSKEAS